MKRYIVFMAVIAVLASACHTKTKDNNDAADLTLSETKTTPPKIVADEEVKAEESPAEKDKDNFIADEKNQRSPLQKKVDVQNSVTTIPNPDWDKKIIKTAHVELDLKDYAKYNQALHTGLKAYGAYISGEEQNTDEYKTQSSVTIKVPVEQFENLMNSFGGEGIKVVDKRISSEEVTAEMIDTKSRLEAKKQTRDQYMNLLKQAKNMKEILEVRNEINSIQEEIESASGRVNYLSHQSSYSTVHLTYYQLIDGSRKPDDKPGYGQRFGHALQTGGDILLSIVLALISAWPLILIVLILYLSWKKRKQLQPAVAEKS